jgi:hypothetical protein
MELANVEYFKCSPKSFENHNALIFALCFKGRIKQTKYKNIQYKNILKVLEFLLNIKDFPED